MSKSTEATKVLEEIMSLEMQADQAGMPYSFGYYDAKQDAAEIAVRVVCNAVTAEREACADVCDELAAMVPGTKTSATLKFASSKIRERR